MDIAARRFFKYNSFVICETQLSINNKRWNSKSSEVIDH